MKTIIIFFLIIFSYLCGDEISWVNPGDLLVKGNMSYEEVNGISSLEINLRNISSTDVYVLASHWYLDGLVDSLDSMLYWIGGDCKVNRVMFKNIHYKRFKMPSYRIELHEGPYFNTAPSFVRIEPDSVQVFNIILNRIVSKVLELDTYNFDVEFNFFTQTEYNNYLNMNFQFHKAILDKNPIRIAILNERNILEISNLMSEIKLEKGQDELIRELIKYTINVKSFYQNR